MQGSFSKSEEAFANEEESVEKRKAFENEYSYLSNMQQKVIDYETNSGELKLQLNNLELLNITLRKSEESLKADKN